MKVKSKVFSKSNIILGVLIAFAMVVLAVPVFAEQPVTVTVPENSEHAIVAGSIQKVEPSKVLYSLESAEVIYNGAEQEPVIIPAQGAGAVKAVHYYYVVDPVKRFYVDIQGKPTQAGRYIVKIDTDENVNFRATNNLEIGAFTIVNTK